MSEYIDVFKNNLNRVEALVSVYPELNGSITKDYKATDVLRAASVFLHSAFEEYFREIIIEWLPMRGDQKIFNDMNLPEETENKKTKFTLYDLRRYHDKTIEELIQESVKCHMNKISFNSYGEICSWGERIDLDFSSFAKGSEIEKAIQRRHRIVHEADMYISESGKKKLRAIKESEVVSWKQAYTELVEIIESQIMN